MYENNIISIICMFKWLNIDQFCDDFSREMGSHREGKAAVIFPPVHTSFYI